MQLSYYQDIPKQTCLGERKLFTSEQGVYFLDAVCDSVKCFTSNFSMKFDFMLIGS